MKIIRHRVNRIAELESLSPEWGAEIDLRSRGNDIILHHDPFHDGDSFDAFAAEWARGKHLGTLILNPKEDGLETRTLELLARHGVTDFFFLDITIPTTVKLACRMKMPKVAVRVSEYETVESALCFAGQAEWAWLDCFSGEPPGDKVISALQGRFRLCLVSPELHAFPPSRIERFRSLVPKLDAVCTKHSELWGPN